MKIAVLIVLALLLTGCTQAGQNPEKPEGAQAPQASGTEAAAEKTGGDLTQQPAEGQQKAPEEKAETNWPEFHGNLARTGYSDSKSPSSPTVLWKWTVEDFMEIGYDRNFEGNWPIIDDNKVFIAPEDIFALDLQTGEKIWQYAEESSGFYPRGLAAGEGKIFASINAGDNLRNLPPGFIYALDESTGSLSWKYQTKKGVSHSLPLYAKGKVFAGDDSGTLYALDAATGKLVWKKSLDAEVVHSSTAYYNGAVFVGTEGTSRSNELPSYLYALDASDGAELWKFQVDYAPGKLNMIHSTPAISEGVVYVGSENGYFYAISTNNGSLKWKQRLASGAGELIGTSGAAAIGYGKAFIGTYEGKFFALNTENGRVEWEYNFGRANADSSPALADGKVCFGSGEGGSGYFYCLDADNGELLWKEKLGGSSAAIASGIMIVHNARADEEMRPDTPVTIAFSDEGKLPLW